MFWISLTFWIVISENSFLQSQAEFFSYPKLANCVESGGEKKEQN